MAALDGVYEKIERAQVHQADLVHRLAAVLGPEHQEFVLDDEPDPETGRYPFRVFGVPSFDSKWRTIIGDCLHNLRSALDHLAYQLVKLDGKDPNKHTYFPIRDTPLNEKGIAKATQLRPAVARPDILAAVEAVQPYKMFPEPGGFLYSPLWILHRLDIIDKHRLLLAAVHTPNVIEIHWGWNPDYGPDPVFFLNRVIVRKDGTAVGWFDFHGQEPPEWFAPNAALHVVVNEEELPNLTDRSVENFLGALIYDVERLIERYFRPLFPPGSTGP